jgi:hypothetical protein
MRYIILLAIAILTLAMAFWLSLIDVARAQVVCNPIAKMKGLKDVGAEPVFLAQGGKGVAYAIYGNPTTGEWIAFVIVEKKGEACNVANGFGYSVVIPEK